MNNILGFEISNFIKQDITRRSESFFKSDLETNRITLADAIDNKNIIVIGGAGTIGSSYIKEILRFNPSKLFVIDISENGLTELVRDIRSSKGYNIPKDFKTYPVNFGDEIFKQLFIKEGPWHIVANFAAHKHVRSEKDEYSIHALIDNNLFKAESLLNMLSKYPPEHFFCVSTDKATNPVNIMGASKKMMENLIIAYSDVFKINTARFANVAFSNGSLLAGYIERIMKRQPLSCPSDIRRFFVSPEESGQICLLSTVLGKTGEIFFPKFDFDKDQTYFKDITLRFINALGMEADVCGSEEEAIEKSKHISNKYPVYFFESDTSGEKQYEEFYTEEEESDLSSFKTLGVIRTNKNCSREEMHTRLNELRELFLNGKVSKADIVELLKKYIPDFGHIETGKNLDSKM
jgi:FlaA1/EpsC-like NDP-sugar epimerase